MPFPRQGNLTTFSHKLFSGCRLSLVEDLLVIILFFEIVYTLILFTTVPLYVTTYVRVYVDDT